jgi:uncharacterized protein (TIGR03435 family)
MKRSNKTTPEQLIAQSPNPTPEQMEFRIVRVWDRVQSAINDRPDETPVVPQRRSAVPKFSLGLAAAALIVLSTAAAVITRGVLQKASPARSSVAGNAPPQIAKSRVSPIIENDVTQVSADQIDGREAFRSEGRTDMTLILPDESRVEMRAQTEVSFERAADGLRILLNNGSILVSAAKQRNGHLYVKTKDVTVSVVGTVFLVKAAPEGSRVAVIEGEVHVEKGATTERLFPGEQVATSAAMAVRPVIEEISWSRHAVEHFATLQQSALPPPAAPGERRDTFEVVSIRPSAPPPGGGGGARGGGASAGPPPCLSANAFAIDLQIQLDPGRLVLKYLPLYSLIGFAYGDECPAPDTLTGGPAWARNEDFDLQATIPAGTPSYTKEQLLSGNAPQLQRMLQNLLADRFKLELKREVKEMQGYNLVVAQQGKLKVSGDQSPDQTVDQIRSSTPQRGAGLGRYPGIPSMAAPISRLARMLQLVMRRPIIDKTGLTGLYDIWLEFPEVPLTPTTDGATPTDPQEINQRIRDLLPSKLEATTGLKLEPAKVPAQVLVIVNSEKPSPN